MSVKPANEASSIIPFKYESNEIRALLHDGEPWFVAKDVCGSLGLGNPTEAIRPLDDDEKGSLRISEGTSSAGGNPNVNIISESGLYALVLRSNKPVAKPFRQWVTKEVLPSIRKTGKYEVSAKENGQVSRMARKCAKCGRVLIMQAFPFVREGRNINFSEVCVDCLPNDTVLYIDTPPPARCDSKPTPVYRPTATEMFFDSITRQNETNETSLSRLRKCELCNQEKTQGEFPFVREENGKVYLSHICAECIPNTKMLSKLRQRVELVHVVTTTGIQSVTSLDLLKKIDGLLAWIESRHDSVLEEIEAHGKGMKAIRSIPALSQAIGKLRGYLDGVTARSGKETANS